MLGLGVGQNLTKFTKITMPESLKKLITFFFLKNKIYMGILRILEGFNSKSEQSILK
jgi:hypothetical protein